MVTACVLAALAVVSPFAAASGAETAVAAPAQAAAYVPVQPCRLADTRTGSGVTRLDPTTVQIDTRNTCGVPSAATSLAVTLTVVDPQAGGFLTAWPADQARPTVSNINFRAGQVRANGSITRLDATGAFRVYTNVAADVVVDVVGAFVPSGATAAGRFVSRPPTRLLDTRGGPALPPGGTVNVRVPAGVPADAVALSLNITVTEASGPGFVTQFPAGRTMPTSSVLNVDRPGQTRAAAGIFPVSSGGAMLYLSGGGHVVVDVVGYFTGPSAPAGTDGLFTAYDPTRLLDTRGASTLGNGTPLHPGGGLEVTTGRGGSMAYNITSADGDAGYVTAYPAGTERPGTSTVNSVGGGDVVANFAITQMSDRGLGVFGQSRTHVLVDLQGWFSGATVTATVAPPINPAPPTPQSRPAPTSGPGYSACVTEGLTEINSQRSSPLVTSAAAQSFACAWALQLAAANGISHSDPAARDAEIGCGTGENVAFSGGGSVAAIYAMWYASSPHMANIRSGVYSTVGTGFVIRTEPDGSQRIFGVNVFATC